MNALNLFAVAVIFASATPSRELAEHSADLQSLNHYAGEWDSRFTIEPLDGVGESKEFVGNVNAKWVVGDRFMEQTGTYRLTPDDDEAIVVKTLMTYDAQQKQYRYVLFVSSGSIHESTGKWDEKSKTMTSVMKDGDKTTTTIANFSTPGEEKWSIETVDPFGTAKLRIRGINTRRKK